MRLVCLAGARNHFVPRLSSFLVIAREAKQSQISRANLKYKPHHLLNIWIGKSLGRLLRRFVPLSSRDSKAVNADGTCESPFPNLLGSDPAHVCLALNNAGLEIGAVHIAGKIGDGSGLTTPTPYLSDGNLT
mgnify:CR=1 FL=1